MSHRVELNWIGGAHVFALGLGELRAVQDACDAGPMQVLNGLRGDHWRVDWPFAVLRHGLIGGGMPPGEARKLLSELSDSHPVARFLVTATLVLAAAIMGVEDDPVGEPTGELSPPESGSSASSTQEEPLPGSPREMSTE
ncbi:gene transfer agent family protein [Defluviimonas sp. SAOS-178_SWC]|uniref:gene transfer agent family protein n=1 Tax=Defluviimonas sp. SAOS-178_SWC TaxID=3121287 RepID=UPI00322152B1